MADKNFYILTFDQGKTDTQKMHEIIKNSPYIKTWWHYLGSTYILVSEDSLDTVHQHIMKSYPKHRYFLAEVNLHNKNGWLPKEAWEWIKKHR